MEGLLHPLVFPSFLFPRPLLQPSGFLYPSLLQLRPGISDNEFAKQQHEAYYVSARLIIQPGLLKPQRTCFIRFYFLLSSILALLQPSGFLYPSLLQLQPGISDVEFAKQQRSCWDRYLRQRYDSGERGFDSGEGRSDSEWRRFDVEENHLIQVTICLLDSG